MEKNNQTTSYIIDESPEISVGESPAWATKILSAFPAFAHVHYRYYFVGQLVSLIGTWLQMVAQGWLVLQITQSAFLVGVIAFLNSLPVLIFALFGGVIVDRFQKRKIIFFTQTVQMVLAFVLGILTILNVVNFTQIAILSFILGIVTALDMPARQAFVIEMVGKEALPSAIALNAGIFNGARVIGPAFAGILITLVGTGGAFILNAFSFLAVMIALYFIKVRTLLPPSHPHPIQAIKEGLVYSFSHAVMRTLLLFVAVTSIFGWSYTTIMPVIAQNVFHRGAAELGILYTATGLGAVLGVVLVSWLSKKIHAIIFIIGGSLLFSVALFFFTLTTSFGLALFLLFFCGMGLIMQLSMTNTSIQHLVPDHLRGRVMSIYTLMFLGMSPVGSLQVGYLAEHFGPQNALRVGAVVLFGVALFIYLRWRQSPPDFA